MLKTESISRTRSRLAAFILMAGLIVPAAAGAASGARQVDGPTLFDGAEYFVKAPGKKEAKPVEGTLGFDANTKVARFMAKGNNQLFEIPYGLITSMLYERTSKPRYAEAILLSPLFLLTRSKKHFLTIQYKGPDGQGQFALIRLDKKNCQTALATAEAQTGIKVERSEER
ncbi:MAG TPA: hypothetical protein VLZ81_14160 [Blastocatellia bacterium]|nr:hypothetical protein [Blastocatellia bacterium]